MISRTTEGLRGLWASIKLYSGAWFASSIGILFICLGVLWALSGSTNWVGVFMIGALFVALGGVRAGSIQATVFWEDLVDQQFTFMNAEYDSHRQQLRAIAEVAQARSAERDQALAEVARLRSSVIQGAWTIKSANDKPS